MSFPDVSDAFDGWDSEVIFHVMKKTTDDFEVVEMERTEIRFSGVLQPLPSKMLLIKPENQRSWKWWQMWTRQLLDMDTLISDAEGVTYRVVSSDDWRNGGFNSYQLVESPK